MATAKTTERVDSDEAVTHGERDRLRFRGAPEFGTL